MPDDVTITDQRHDSLKDTIESIVVALILAFVFRAFVVEAFVIPTGSMAPTLYGAHGTIICEECGIEFAYGLTDASENHGVSGGIGFNSKAYCPNCRHANTNLTINDGDRLRHTPGNPESGDRILVHKWPFDIGGSIFGPSRWDVTVFKDPADGTTNFIKRLVGLPGEVLMILDGDVFAAPLADLSPRTVSALDELRHEKFLLRSGARRGPLSPTPRFVLRELDEKLKIVRKSRVAQKSLQLRVYDHDFPPRTLAGGQPHWQSASGDASGFDTSGRRIVFSDRGLADDTIELRGAPIRATCAYNIRKNAPRPETGRSLNGSGVPFAADVRVRFVLTPMTGDPSVTMRLEKLGRRFVARVRMDGRVSVDEARGTQNRTHPLTMSTQIAPLRFGTPIEVSFENLDYRLAVSVGGDEVLVSSDSRDSAAYYGPQIAALRLRRLRNLPCRPRIGGAEGDFALTHLVVERDIYYFPGINSLRLSWLAPAGIATWASSTSPMMLRDHEYFMLGDNTAASKDSRLWDAIGPHLQDRGEDVQLGAVPEDQLIGKAFLVYWPSMQRIDWLNRLPFFKRYGVVPDVGRMRWIR